MYTCVVMASDYHAERRISTADGLSNDFVLSLDIDGQGHVWVATEAGVNRIAGKSCQPFPINNNLEGARITSLYWDAASAQMLIGTERGLSVYRPADGTTRWLNGKNGLVASSINHIAPAADGLWLAYGNGQVQKLRFVSKEIQTITLKLPEALGNRCVLDDGAGHLYIGHSHNGMTVVSLGSGKTTRYQCQQGSDHGLPGNNVRCIVKDRQKHIWVGTDRGLARFHPETGTFTKQPTSYERYDDNVYDICEMDDGTLWVATDMGGVRILKADHTGAYHATGKARTSSLNTRSIVHDDYGNIWIGNHSTGVDFISSHEADFKVLGASHPACAIAYSGNCLWVAGENALSCWQEGQQAGSWTGLNTQRREYSSPRCMMADRNGMLWIGVDDQGVTRFDTKRQQFKHIPMMPEGSDIHSFAQADDGSIWVGAEFGVYQYADGHMKRHDFISQTLHAPATCLLSLPGHRLFVATLGDGIYSFNLDTNGYQHLGIGEQLPSGKINHVASTGTGLWLATDGGLVSLEDPVGLSGLTTYNHRQGLNDDHIRALQPSANGDIWLSNYMGISRFDQQAERFYNFGTLDAHLPSGFASGAAVSGDDGTIFFGSASGVCFFNPRLQDNQQPVSEVQMVTLEAYNPVGNDTEIMLLTPDEKGRVSTTHKRNTLRMTFDVRNFAQTEYVEFSYMMKGMDNKWYYIGNDHDVVFRGLRPGHYTFVLRAKLRSQDWDEARQTQLKVTITPPFWLAWWAFLLYAAAIVLWGVWLMRRYKHQLALRTSLELERRDSQQKQHLNEERLRFFTNITHELRTPLTLILGPLDDLMDDPQLPPASHRRVQMIKKSAERLRSLINEILEFRKAETQNRRLTVAKADIGSFVREICLNFKELNQNQKVSFLCTIDDRLPNIYFDSEVISTILNNLLSNAIKYTGQGSITTTVKVEAGDMVSICVADTGYGITPEALPHIFDRYYQANDAHQASGTGIGLALVKALADLHEGQLKAESAVGEGSRFTFLLNATNTYPNALHKEDSRTDETAEQEQETVPATASETDGQLPLLLVVEDNADIRQYIADSLGEDLRILEAEDGEEGVKLAEQHTPDIIVSDIMMPRMNGIELTRKLKNDMRTSHIPIVLLTAKTTDDDKLEGYDSGADSYLTKPFTARLLASRIHNLLTARRRLAEQIGSLQHTNTPTPQDDTNTQKATTATAEDTTSQLSRLDREFLEKLDSIITDNIMSQDIDLPFITSKMAMSHSTFYRKVKALTGMTATEYIRKFRLRHCYKLLESGDYNVTEAAMMTGFNQMAHFRETFKREFGILPSEVLRKK